MGESKSFFWNAEEETVYVVRCEPTREFLAHDLDRAEHKGAETFRQENFRVIQSEMSLPVQITIATQITEEEIRKRNHHEYQEETYEDYQTQVLPKIEKIPIPWMEKLIFEKSEERNVYYRDEQVVIAKDMDWNGEEVGYLNVLGMVTERKLKSIRDLTADHLPLLEHLQEQGFQAIEKTFKVPRNQIKAYLHYHPSYWWLHVHFTHVQVGYGCLVDRSHELTQVIENLRLVPDYYQRVKLRIKKREW